MHPSKAPPTCERCGKAERYCVCYAMQILPSKLKLLILQHPKEAGEALGSAIILHLAHPDSRLCVGLSWPNLSKALGQVADPKEWAVLYLGSARLIPGEHVKAPTLLRVTRKDKAVPEELENLSKLRGVVLLDGNWRQVKSLWWRNPWLLKLKRLLLIPQGKSLYGKLRREPRSESVSTLEAAAQTMAIIEQNDQIEEMLLRPFSELVRRS
ncbi:MAG: DTW domain-containing protein [Proteobacteria bacterium]|nr:MAG: DTW domain-containing protein [Pseudomonadota bacterium]